MSRFGAVFLSETRRFLSPVEYIDHCLKCAYVAKGGICRLSERLASQQTAKSPSPLSESSESDEMDLQSILSQIKRSKSKEIDVNFQDKDGVTALMLAARQGSAEKINLLLKRGADVSIEDKDKKTAIHWAATNPVKHGKLVEVLVDRCVCVCAQNLKCLKMIADSHKPSFHFQDCFQQSVVHIATAEGNVAILEFMAKKGVSLTLPDIIGCRPLHWAAFMDQVNCAQFLLNQKYGDSGLTNKEKHGALPIHYAAIRGNVHIFNLLMDKMDWLNSVDEKGFSPLAWALFSDSINLVENLVKSGADLGTKDGKGRTVLHLAAHLGLSSICQLLLAHSAEIHAADHSQSIPLLLAAKHGHAHTTNCLIQSGSSVIATDERQRTAVHLAARAGHADVVEVLLDCGAERDATDANGARAIQLAAESGRTEVVRLLLRRGADGLVTDADGRSLLHKAAKGGFTDCCQILISAGISVNAPDNSIQKLTALDLALLGQHKACADFLISCGSHTNGGMFHRSAALIQAWWKFKRHKHRQGIAREHATLVLQCAARQLLARVQTRRLKDLQLRVQHRAVSVIQKHWKTYIAQKRRYEADYAALKAKLMKEKEKALAALKLIKEQEHFSVVPPIDIPASVPKRRPLITAPFPVMKAVEEDVPVALIDTSREAAVGTSARISNLQLVPVKCGDKAKKGGSEPEKAVKLPGIMSQGSSVRHQTERKGNTASKAKKNISATLEKQNRALLQSVMERDREIQRLREENRRLSSIQRVQARELAGIRERVQLKDKPGLMSLDSSPIGRPTQLQAGETSVSNTSLTSFAKTAKRPDHINGTAERWQKELAERRLNINKYKDRCEELRRVIQSIKEMQAMLRSRSGGQAMKGSREELKKQIKSALEEVIRLRSETDALETQIGVD